MAALGDQLMQIVVGRISGRFQTNVVARFTSGGVTASTGRARRCRLSSPLFITRHRDGKATRIGNRLPRVPPQPKDVTMATTILDRLMHRCSMLEFEGRSYRLKEAANRLAISTELS
jgi:hypothetical protein